MKYRLSPVLTILLLAAVLLSSCGGNGGRNSAAPAAPAGEVSGQKAEAEEISGDSAGEDSPEGEAGKDDFSLMDVEADMVVIGIYGIDDRGEEQVFTIFQGPDEKAYASLFTFDNKRDRGEVICGPYTAETQSTGDGADITLLDVEDVYSGETVRLGVAETGDAVVFFNREGKLVEGRYLSPEETIDYMAAAVNALAETEDRE